MADIATTYTLTTPGPDIVFNTGDVGDGTDKYWLTSISGLDGSILRVPFDLVSFGNGYNVHTTRKAGRLPVFDGMLLIESPVNCMARRNALSDALEDALDSMLSPATGTLSWTPDGLSARTLVVSTFVGYSITYSDNYTVSNFSFTLISQAADPS